MAKKSRTLGIVALVTCGINVGTITAATAPKRTDGQQLVSDLGECGGALVRLVTYDQEVIFGQNDRGDQNSFQLQDYLKELNGEFEEVRRDLQNRGKKMHAASQEQDPTDLQSMAKTMKDQNALEIDSKLAQQKYQKSFAELQGKFLKEVLEAIKELAEEFGWDVVLPVDKKSAFVAEKVDVTDQILRRLNDKYRERDRKKTKKFSEVAAKKEKV